MKLGTTLVREVMTSDVDAIPADVYTRARLLFLNYPNNPTGGTADLPFFEKVIKLAKAHNLVIAQDAATR